MSGRSRRPASARASARCASSPMRSSLGRIFEIDGAEAAGALAGALFTARSSSRFTNRCASPTAARATVFLYAAPFLVAFGAAFLLRTSG